jgi:histidinol-phosphate phosphatase family protein
MNPQWTLFLDRDGIINKKITDGYVLNVEQFVFKEDFLQTIPAFRENFGRIIIVTNQQGIAKGLMSETDLQNIHQYLLNTLKNRNITIDAIYCCPHLEESNSYFRKPDIGMAQQAQKEFPEIDFKKSLMIGDSLTDILFGRRCGMLTALVDASLPPLHLKTLVVPDFYVRNLVELTSLIF